MGCCYWCGATLCCSSGMLNVFQLLFIALYIDSLSTSHDNVLGARIYSVPKRIIDRLHTHTHPYIQAEKQRKRRRERDTLILKESESELANWKHKVKRKRERDKHSEIWQPFCVWNFATIAFRVYLVCNIQKNDNSRAHPILWWKKNTHT